MKVLVVEDNVLNQKLVSINLSKIGYEYDIANNGIEAVTKFKENNFDLVLMDIMMPVMDGFIATIEIREYEKKLNHKTPIIGLTANNFNSEKEKCLECGMNDFMTKPFDLKVFIATIQKLGLID